MLKAVGSEDGDNSILQDIETRDMAELNEPRINDDQFIQTSISDVSLWKKSPKETCPERSDVINGVIQNQRADYLAVVLEHGWDLNEMLQICMSERGRVERTALHHAVFHGWHEGVRLLLKAGANCNIKCEWSGETDLSVPQDLVWDQRRHFGSKSPKHVPLCVAIYKDDVEMVKLLLEQSADLEDSSCDYCMVNLDRLKIQQWQDGWTEVSQKENSKVLDVLLTNGKKVIRNMNAQLQELLIQYIVGRQFYPEHLDIIFAHGVHIDPEHSGDTLEYALSNECPINAIRWLIRHGASTTSSLYPVLSLASIVYRMMEFDGFLVGRVQRYKLPVMELLLQVGIKHSDSLKVNLGEMELVIQAYLQREDSEDKEEDIIRQIANIYHDIIYGERQMAQFDQKKLLSIDREQQMEHLKEFAGHSLHVYPEKVKISVNKQECWEQTLKMISNMLHFLNQPRTLQWHCRVCLRESLVSLSPSAISILSAPPPLKRYILCHEL